MSVDFPFPFVWSLRDRTQEAIDLSEMWITSSLSLSLLLFLGNTPDTETLYTVVTQNILNEYSPGTVYTWDVKVTLMGLQKEAVSKKIVEIYDLPLTWQEYAELAQVQIELLMKNCRLMPGMIWSFW